MHNGVSAVAQSSRGHGGAQHTPQRLGQPQVSQALLQGAREIASIFEKRIANVKAEYEDKLKLITRERDELLAQKASAGIPQIVADELEALRDDRDGHEQERAQWETERGAFLQERSRYQQECEALRKSQQELQEEVMRIRHRMEEEVATRDATIAALQERVKLLEAAQSRDVQQRQQPAVNEQADLDSLDVFQSPRQPCSAGHPELPSSTLGTISPSQQSVPMQVDAPAPAPSSSPKSPSLTLNGGKSPPKSPTITVPGGQSPSIARSPTMVSQSGAPSSSSSGSSTRLVIRVPPPPNKNVRKPIKPPISPPTEEEQRNFVHVPRQKNSSDEASSGSSSGSSSTSSSATHSP